MSAPKQKPAGKAADTFKLSKEQCASMLANLNIKDAVLLEATCFLDVSDVQWSSVVNIRDAMAYLGFDPRKIIREFLKKAASNAKAATDLPKKITIASGGSFEIYLIYEKNDAATDLLFFLTTFLERGNNITKILLKCDKETGDLLRRKAADYGLVMEKKQTSTILSTSSLTLARLSQAFPVATVSIIVGHKIEGKIKTKGMAGVSVLPVRFVQTRYW